MWSNRKQLVFSVIFSLTTVSLFSQAEKGAFVPDNFLHVKVGTTMNLYNKGLYEALNDIEDGNGRFTPFTSINFNPLVELAFERQMTKIFGLTLHLGFTQTRARYMYDNNTTFIDVHQKGLVLGNVPNFGLAPTFYFKNTRFMIGTGWYKYYYSFRPMDAGYIHFNLNMEGSMFYNRISVMQTFKLSSRNVSLTASYFGFQRKFDNGFQLALGLEL